MTRKDFELIARVLRDAEPAAATSSDPAINTRRTAEHCVWTDIAADFADALAGTNERFDRGRFLKAATGEGA